MNKQTITCKKCGYIYWIDNVSWSVIPPDMNCPNCLPAASVNTSYSGRAINERNEESADWKELVVELASGTCYPEPTNSYEDLTNFIQGLLNNAIQAERTRIIGEIGNLYPKECGELSDMGVCGHYHGSDIDNTKLLDQAIKAVEKGNK